ncbi:dihydrodipicolinate synthase family protein [Breznakiella homolactica]|uniref:Dihydrodipicolinate synthase family protein n=1 Tax=Breznakiella homolactica TaxID=2798577 RepID=A0A7T8B9M4_9SPIR|nr:dihydrodipicolinate synthase family protein [Breznakiella homolactica]QQO08105.1 dihydrodipicolinate synthase family protein [Breznakiella homolactica]
MKQKLLRGIFAPLTTPFSETGDVRYDHLEYNMEKYAASGIQGYLVFGSNGENKSLLNSEKEKILASVIRNKAPGQIVMAGSIYESTMETIEFALLTAEAGADYITLLAPSYFKSEMKDSVLVKYFTDVASAVGIPCLLYRAPQFSGGIDLSPRLVRECAEHPNIAGIKDSSSGGIEKILHAVPESFSVLSGSANTFFPAMLNGAAGGVLSLADYLPGKAVELYDAIAGGSLGKASELNRKIIALNIEISGTYGVAGVKSAMDSAGFRGGVPRLPLLPIPPEGAEKIKKILNTYP